MSLVQNVMRPPARIDETVERTANHILVTPPVPRPCPPFVPLAPLSLYPSQPPGDSQLDDMRPDSPHPVILAPLASGFNSHLNKNRQGVPEPIPSIIVSLSEGNAERMLKRVEEITLKWRE